MSDTSENVSMNNSTDSSGISAGKMSRNFSTGIKFPTLSQKGAPASGVFDYDTRPMWQKILTRKKNNQKRGDIQALRALAVTCVLIYHLWPNVIPGGYVGVDVFFVISGYLITNQIVREFSKSYHKTRKRVSIVGIKFLYQFYAARIRRIAPLSVTVLAVTTFAIHFLFTSAPAYQDATFEQIISSLLLMQNIRLEWNQHDYLHQMNDATAVNHFWSLSVEEQYYLVWPLIAIIVLCIVFGIIEMIARRKLNQVEFVLREKGLHKSATIALAITVGLVCVASFAYLIYLSTANPITAYFSILTRMWELGMGSVLTCIVIATKKTLSISYTANSQNSKNQRTSHILAFFQGLTVIVILTSAFVFNSTDFLYPSAWTLIPVLASFLYIFVASNNVFVRFRFFQYIGDISYSLYLWHWALIVLVRKWLEIDPNAPKIDKDIVLWLILLAAFILSALSYRLIETPFRKHFSKKNLTVYACGAVSLVVVFAVTIGFNISITNATDVPLDRLKNNIVKGISAEEKVEQNALYNESDLCIGAISILHYKNPKKSNGNGVCENVKSPSDWEDSLVYTLPIAHNDWSMPYQFNCFHTLNPERLGLTKVPPTKVCEFGDTSKEDYLLLIGDSHAAHWSGAFDYASKKVGLKLIVAAGVKGCTYLYDVDNDECSQFVSTVDGLISNPHAKFVFVSSNVQYDNADKDRQMQVVSKMKKIKIANNNIFAIEDAPDNSTVKIGSMVGPEYCIFKHDVCSVPKENVSQSNFFSELKLNDVLGDDRVVKSNNQFCDKELCYFVIGNVSVYYDANERGHISDSYSKSMGPWLVSEFKKKDIVGVDYANK